jgi:RNA polymerase sigma-70 factor (ECF subfamily)
MGFFARFAPANKAVAGGPSATPAIGCAPKTLDASDLGALVQANADFVWRSLRRLGVPDAWADDATQQVFVVAQQKITNIQAGRERAFLFSVSMNVAAHVRRAAARRREVFGDDATLLADPAPSQDAALDRCRARALLDQVLDEMPEELRSVFVLAELEELTLSEIARMLEIPQGTATSRLRRAREEFHKQAQRLRARLSPRTAPPAARNSTQTPAGVAWIGEVK